MWLTASNCRWHLSATCTDADKTVLCTSHVHQSTLMGNAVALHLPDSHSLCVCSVKQRDSATAAAPAEQHQQHMLSSEPGAAQTPASIPLCSHTAAHRQQGLSPMHHTDSCTQLCSQPTSNASQRSTGVYMNLCTNSNRQLCNVMLDTHAHIYKHEQWPAVHTVHRRFKCWKCKYVQHLPAV